MLIEGLGDLAIFPCKFDKKPLIAAWQKNAKRIEPPDHWPLVAVPTGEANGFDVLDIDPDAHDWLRENDHRLPRTRAHRTPRGLHILFRHREGVRNSVKKLALGLDTRTTNGYIIWYPRQGYPVEEAVLADWPEWLFEEILKSGAASHRTASGKCTL